MKNYFLKKLITAILLIGSMYLLFLSQFIQAFKDIRWNIADDANQINSILTLDELIERLNREIELHIRYPEFSENIYTALYQVTGKEEYNRFEIVRTKENSLLQVAFYNENDDNLYYFAKRFRRLSEQVEKQGGTALFVSIPGKSSIINNVSSGLPYLDYGSIQDEFLNALLSNRVQAIDMRQFFDHPKVDKDKLFYRTDKSLTNYGAFYVFKAIVSEIEEKNGIVLNPNNTLMDLEQYEKETYPKVMYGELAKSISKKQQPYEDYTLYYPDEQGTYKWEITHADGSSTMKRGKLYQTIFQKQYLNSTTETDSSYVVLGKNNPVDSIINESNPQGLRVLLIRDDNMAPVAAFFLPYCYKMDMVMADTNLVSIETMVKKGDYQLVIMGMSPERLRNSYFPFFKQED